MDSGWESIKLLWRRDKLHLFLIAYFMLLYSWMYRVALRAFMDGEEFRWVTLFNLQMMDEERRAFIAGNGTDGHFLLVLLLALGASAIFYLLIRRPDTFTKIALVGWAAVFFAHQCTLALLLGEDYIIRGDTMGLVLPFYIIGPVQHGLMVILLAWWCLRTYNPEVEFPPLTSSRKNRLLKLVASLSVVFLLFRFGEQHGLTDQLGIVTLYALTIGLMFNLFHLHEVGVSDE